MSDMLPIERLMNTLRVRVPGATDPMLQLEAFNTIDEFLRETNAWKYQTQFDLELGVTEYSLATPAGSVLVRIDGVSHNGQPVVNAASSVIQSSTGILVPDQVFPDGDANFDPFSSDINPVSHVFSYAIYRPTYIQINNPPTDSNEQFPFVVDMVLSLSGDTLSSDPENWSLPDWMYDMYFGDWLNGVLSKMYGMPAKPWMNIQLAQYHGRLWKNRKSFRRQEVRRGFQANTPTWRFPRSGW